MSQETLWIDPSGRWEIARHENGKIMVIDNDRGVNDCPIDYGKATWTTARIGYDHPEWFPEYVKDATAIIMTQPDGDLKTVRLQLCQALAFMYQTTETGRDPDGFLWSGDMPGYPAEYEPLDWQEENWRVEEIWHDFLCALDHFGLDDRYNEAMQLPLADLFAMGNPYTLEKET